MPLYICMSPTHLFLEDPPVVESLDTRLHELQASGVESGLSLLENTHSHPEQVLLQVHVLQTHAKPGKVCLGFACYNLIIHIVPVR